MQRLWFQENPSGGAAGDAEFPLNNQRPMIEDHLGHYSDSDLDELQQKLNSLNDSAWPESLALPRVPSCVSSHRSPRSTLVKGRSTQSQKFRFDCPPAGSEPPSQPCHASRNTFQRDSNLEGSEDQEPCTAGARGAAPYLGARLQDKGRCDECLPSDINSDALEDLSQLMKKKQELEVELFLVLFVELFQSVFHFIAVSWNHIQNQLPVIHELCSLYITLTIF